MATRELWSNNGTSTLLGTFNIGATSCSVQAGHGARFRAPAAGELFRLTLKDAAGNIEICYCTQRTVDTFNTVVRAQEGTTERDWLSGDLIEGRITRASLEGFPQKNAVETISEAWTFAKTVTNKHGADVASANNMTLGDGNIFNITGSTTINTIVTKGVGTFVMLHFAAATTLTHHATDMILPGAANIVTVAGDTAIFEEYAAGDWRCIAYQRASGLPLATSIASGTAAGMNGLEYYVFGNLPANVKRITCLFERLSTTGGTGTPQVQIGDSGGIEATGYISAAMTNGATRTSITGFVASYRTDNAALISGMLVLTLLDPTTNTWVASGNVCYHTSAFADPIEIVSLSGIKALSGPLTQVQLMCQDGVGSYDYGNFNIFYET